MSLMGIDIGTSGCKSAVYSVNGDLLASSRRTYSPVFPEPGRMELVCSEILDAILETIQDTNRTLDSNPESKADPVTALSVGSFSEAVVPLSRNGEILGNSIAGSDNRYTESVDILNEFDKLELYRINPNILSFTYTYPKIAWYRDKSPELFANVWKLVNWSDYLVYFLTGNLGASYSHATRTLLFDIVKEEWSEEILNKVNLDRSILADPVPGDADMGTVKPDVAIKLGFSERVKVVAGGHDQCMNALGAGAVGNGQSVTGIGTFECTTLVFDNIPEFEMMHSMNLGIEHHVIPGKYVTLIYNQAGSLQTWFIKAFAKDLIAQGLDEEVIINKLIAEVPENPSGIIFLPTIEPTGAPYFFNGMTGAFFGIHANSSRGDLYKAVLEGESMYFFETFNKLEDSGLPVNEFIASGGGSRSDLWLQIKADLFGKPVKRAEVLDAGTFGGALLAGISSGEYESVEEAVSNSISTQTAFVPDMLKENPYKKQLEQFSYFFHLHG